MSEMSVLQFAALLGTMRDDLAHGNRDALEKAATIVETEAKSAVGTYKYGWPHLADSTLKQKGADTPLLRTGALRGSIEHAVVSEHEAQVGSNDPKIAYHELGTTKMPPRPLLSEAAKRKEAEVHNILGEPALKALRLK